MTPDTLPYTGILSDTQLITISLRTGVNPYGIHLSTREIATLLKTDPSNVRKALRVASDRLSLLVRGGLL